jgi:hypothetical protein
MGGHSAIILAIQLIDENIIKKILCGLRWPPIDVFDATTMKKSSIGGNRILRLFMGAR